MFFYYQSQKGSPNLMLQSCRWPILKLDINFQCSPQHALCVHEECRPYKPKYYFSLMWEWGESKSLRTPTQTLHDAFDFILGRTLNSRQLWTSCLYMNLNSCGVLLCRRRRCSAGERPAALWEAQGEGETETTGQSSPWEEIKVGEGQRPWCHREDRPRTTVRKQVSGVTLWSEAIQPDKGVCVCVCVCVCVECRELTWNGIC